MDIRIMIVGYNPVLIKAYGLDPSTVSEIIFN